MNMAAWLQTSQVTALWEVIADHWISHYQVHCVYNA